MYCGDASSNIPRQCRGLRRLTVLVAEKELCNGLLRNLHGPVLHGRR